ncbi:hypothetical protein AVEN_210102-1 [Araneus ventricosus]|uniref:Uncharacterized protein n=1 Tax=Araneus ventricosus TaxID=182803 RepID=A0A4Y2G8R6_ARAVE|nr:hypothetical protein AVEN_210102-1 [Araneus ventricosus]
MTDHRFIPRTWNQNDCFLKAGNSHLFQTGNFGTREGKNNRQGRKSMKFRTNYSKRWNSHEIKFQQFVRRFFFETPNEARTAHQRSCQDWNFATRLENRKSDEWGEPKNSSRGNE